MTEVEECFAKIVRRLKAEPKVTVGTSGRKGFGSSALCVGDKIFAMVSSKGHFVVKLPKERVDVLAASEAGERFESGGDRVMKEWLAVNPGADEDWLALAKEAMEFVRAQKKRKN